MLFWTQKCALVCAVVFAVFVSPPAQAVIFLDPEVDESHNTTAPTGELADSGWQFVGFWGSFTGMPISENLFITAKHVGGSLGSVFTFRGVEYETIASFADPNSDLRIWKICGQFPEFAPLYTNSDETGKQLVVFGRGTQRGAEISVGGVLGEEAKGWRWGSADHVLRWGQNRVTAVINNMGLPAIGGGGGESGLLLKVEFNAMNPEPNEAHLSSGDSGGAVFIHDGETWKLAGVNYAVDGLYNTTNAGNGFNAAIFDEGGLYKGSNDNWNLQLDLPADRPGSFYATQISSNLDWINSVLSQESGNAAIPEVFSSGVVDGQFTQEQDVIFADETHLTLPLPDETRFYRLESCVSFSISDIQVSDGRIVLEYSMNL